MREIKIIERMSTVNEFVDLRKAVGFPIISGASLEAALNSSLYSICVIDGSSLVGFGRVIGDGALYFYIQDMMIHPDYQGKGLGETVMSKLMKFIDEHSKNGTFIGLMSVKGKEGFYKRFGFIERPNEQFGAGMCLYKRDS